MKWAGRDRFVLSVGHSSLTQYIQLYLGGFGLELDDLKSLRTWGSLTPGHPEVNHTDGVEITTGPLGQGLASAVGMAMASRKRAAFSTRPHPQASPLSITTSTSSRPMVTCKRALPQRPLPSRGRKARQPDRVLG